MRENDPAELAELAPSLRARVDALLRAARGAVWITSGRRSTEQQIQLRREHCGPTWYDIWRKPAKQCRPQTAIPGTSKHETGEAVDLGGDLRLAARLARQVGIHFPIASEDWHGEVDPTSRIQGFAGIPFPIDPGPIGGPILDAGADALGDVAGAVTEALASTLETITEPLLEGASRIALVGVLVAGGVGLVVLGGVRGVQSTWLRGADL